MLENTILADAMLLCYPAITEASTYQICFVSSWTASQSCSASCWCQVRGQKSKRVRVPFLGKLSPVEADSPFSSLQIFSLLSALLSNPCSRDTRTPPLQFQSVTLTCGLLNPNQASRSGGGHHLLPMPHLSSQQLWGLRSRLTGGSVAYSCNLCDNCSLLEGRGESQSWGRHSHFWTDKARMSIWSSPQIWDICLGSFSFLPHSHSTLFFFSYENPAPSNRHFCMGQKST